MITVVVLTLIYILSAIWFWKACKKYHEHKQIDPWFIDVITMFVPVANTVFAMMYDFSSPRNKKTLACKFFKIGG